MNFFRKLAVFFLIALFAMPVLPQESRSKNGGLEGTVINKNTQRFLERAVVKVLETEISVQTDTEGRFRIPGLAAGTYQITASYTGLGSTTKSVTVKDGSTTKVEFELTNTDVYESSDANEVTITSPLEGVAAAINSQQQAETQRTVVSVDTFIDQTTGNPGEFLKSVQGIQMDYSQNEPQSVRIRGFDPNLTTVTMDGNEIASASSTSANRAVQLDQLSIASIENVEVFKAPIPSMSANSIGGAVNFNNKSAFLQKGSRIVVSFGLNVDGNTGFSRYGAVGQGEKSGLGLFPIGRFEYSNSFFKNRLGLFFSTGHDRTKQLGSSVSQNLNYTGQPAPPTTVTTDNTTIRRGALAYAPNRQLRDRNDISLNTDYRVSDNASIYLRTTYSLYHSTNRNHGFTLTPGTLAAGNTLTDYTTTGTNSTAAQSASVFDKFTNTLQVSPGFKFYTTKWKLDIGGGISKSVNHYKNDNNFGALSINLTNVNFSVSSPTDTDTPTSVTQTSGPDFYNLNNYKPNQGNLLANGGETRANDGGIVSTNVRQSSDVKQSFRVDLQRDFNTEMPFYLKGGFSYNQGIRDKNQPQRRWYWVGDDGVASADDLTSAANLGRFAEPLPVTQGLSDFNLQEPTYLSTNLLYQYWQQHPQVLQENLAYAKQQEFAGRQYVNEKVLGYYFMGSIRIKKLNILSGLRVEQTRIKATGFRVLPTTGNSPDRVDLAGANANSLIGIIKTYRFATSQFNYTSKPFPYLHLKYDWLSNLQTRFSYTEAIGRPNLSDVLPNFTQNDTNLTITTNRTGLLPQRSKNLDFSMEYYPKSAGEWTFGWFSRDVKDFISSATIPATQDLLTELNLGPEYSTYQIITKTNLGNAKWTGYEIAVRQKLGDWKLIPENYGNIEIFANFTHLYKVSGTFGTATTANPAGTQITTLANLVPKLFNAGISYRSRKGRFFANLITNYQSARSTVNLPAQAAADQRSPQQEAYQFWNLEMSYTFNKHWKLTSVVRNLTGVRPTFTQVGIVTNRQQDSGPAWTTSAKWTF